MYDATFKVVVLGEAGVGKTTFVDRFLGRWGPTSLGIHIPYSDVKSVYIDGKNVKLKVWDFSGEERFRFLLPPYVRMRGADGVIIMYDVTNYTSLAHIDDWLLVIRREIKTEQDPFSILLVGNKADLVEDREVAREDGINFAKSRGLQGFIECSAKTGKNVEEAFIGLTKIMLYLESKVDYKEILEGLQERNKNMFGALRPVKTLAELTSRMEQREFLKLKSHEIAKYFRHHS